MKKLLSVLLTLMLCVAAAPVRAETPDEDVTAMLPALDALMCACIRLERGYDPSDRGFFWTTLGVMAVDWHREDSLCETVDGELRVPRRKMQELAAAAFAEYSELLPLPLGRFLCALRRGVGCLFRRAGRGGTKRRFRCSMQPNTAQ